MDLFRYHNGRLVAEEVEVQRIAAEVGTPAYIYSKATFIDHLRKMQEAYAQLETTICFSIKACSNIHILRLRHRQRR
jgi:diaminopimelate decarboxylase